jgi:hypothetical protein
MRNSADSDDDGSGAYIKPAKKTKPTAQASMTDFFAKKPAAASCIIVQGNGRGSGQAIVQGYTASARKASRSTSKAPRKKATARKSATQSSDYEISLNAPESVPLVACSRAPRRAAAARQHTSSYWLIMTTTDHIIIQFLIFPTSLFES